MLGWPWLALHRETLATDTAGMKGVPNQPRPARPRLLTDELRIVSLGKVIAAPTNQAMKQVRQAHGS